MPVDAKLDCAYFMKKRDRLLKLIKFLKENEEVTDKDILLRSMQEKISRQGLGLRDSYSISAMACLPTFVGSFGGVEYFRSAPLELIAGHRALALYTIHYLEDVTKVQEKCPYYKCSPVMAEKLYRKIFQLQEKDKISKEELRGMLRILHSQNYQYDYFDLKETPLDTTWRKDDFLKRVKEFIQQQIEYDKKKDEKLMKSSKVDAHDQGGERVQRFGEDHAELCQIGSYIHEAGASARKEENAASHSAQPQAPDEKDQGQDDNHAELCQFRVAVDRAMTPVREKAGSPIVQDGHEALDIPEDDVSGFETILRRSTRKIRAPKKLDL